jgi:hypothetical protein
MVAKSNLQRGVYSITILITLLLAPVMFACSAESSIDEVNEPSPLAFFQPDNEFIQYIGRIDFSNRALPRFWAPGVYIRTAFNGTECEIIINDEMLWGNSHNYVSVVIDDQPVKRIKLTSKVNTLRFADLIDGDHSILICKTTESGIGYLEFGGIKCKKLLPPPSPGQHRIEFIGNSITCGMGSDQSVIPCDKAEWYDQHNAYMGYGPLTARALQADWMLTAVSGIGLIKSCCNLPLVMPEVYDKINLRENKIEWRFGEYTPDVVTICLGQNDGIQDSTVFCNAYSKFIKTIRGHYPNAFIVCLTSPMADEKLMPVMKRYLTGIMENARKNNDPNVYSYFFKKQYKNGCGYHPDLAEHVEIAAELTAFIKELKQW